MGTNYYVDGIPDPDEEGTDLHVGKASFGWVFLFHAVELNGRVLHSTITWWRALKGQRIRDEYGNDMDRESFFIQVVDPHLGGQSGGEWEDAEGNAFHRGEFC